MNRVYCWSSSLVGGIFLMMGVPGLAFDKAALSDSQAIPGERVELGTAGSTPNHRQASAAAPQSLLDVHRNALQSGHLNALSDENLTVLASYWGMLTPAERRHLLAEMRGRMARSRSQLQRLNIPKGRQYGKVIRKVRKVRQPDGSILVETRVLKVTPQATTETHSVSGHDAQGAAIAPTTRARVTFGIGFEQRAKGARPRQRVPQQIVPATPPGVDAATPVITVVQPAPAAHP